MRDDGFANGSSGSPRYLRILSLAVGGVLLLLIGFGAGVGAMWFAGTDLQRAVSTLVPGQPAPAVAAPPEESLDLLREVWTILQDEYVDPDELEDQELLHSAASGMVEAVGDPHTVFVEPLPASIMDQDMQGSFEGIGASVDMVDGKIVIVRPLENSPALEAGIKAGDIILAVDGEPLEGKTLMEAISMIRGPRGTVVRLLIQRDGVAEPFVVPVTRDKVELVTVEYRMVEGGIAYVRLTEFNAIARDRLHAALKELLKEEPKGLVFDLRSNPGGYLDMAVEVAGEFLPKGALVLTESERDRDPREYRVRGRGLATEVPLVVLVDGGSASASEIVAGAIRDHSRGTLIGERTYGKGSVQNPHRLADGSSLRVTVARWYLPNGDNLDGALGQRGIVPDIEVTRSPEEAQADLDPQLDRAVAFLMNGE
jgi:carboxyl-terminal processing protease